MQQGFGVLGSAKEAWFIREHEAVIREKNLVGVHVDRYEVTPDGWEYLGSGVSRSAYLSPTGVVYKVASYDSCNVVEHAAASLLRKKLGEGSARTKQASKYLVFPKTRLFADGRVLAMEYMRGTRPCESDPAYKEAVSWATRLSVGLDSHCGNLVELDDGRFALIDLGYEDYDEHSM